MFWPKWTQNKKKCKFFENVFMNYSSFSYQLYFGSINIYQTKNFLLFLESAVKKIVHTCDHLVFRVKNSFLRKRESPLRYKIRGGPNGPKTTLVYSKLKQRSRVKFDERKRRI